MNRTIDGHICAQIEPSQSLRARAQAWMSRLGHDHPGYWVKLTPRIYAYQEHTGDTTFWRTV